MTSTGNPEFVRYFMAGQLGLKLPDNATQEMKDAYGRGRKVLEVEKEIKNATISKNN